MKWLVLVGLSMGCSTVLAEEPESRTVLFREAKLHLRVAGPEGGRAVLLLHGGRFHSGTWQEIGTYAWLAAEGYRVIGLDLPGFGRSEEVDVPREEFLAKVLPLLGLERPVVVAPSMSGGFALPFVIGHPESVSGFVPVAPAGIRRYEARLHEIRAPTLIVWGENDDTIPLSEGELLNSKIEGSRIVVLEGARHPCYLDRPEAFHEALLRFLETIQD